MSFSISDMFDVHQQFRPRKSLTRELATRHQPDPFEKGGCHHCLACHSRLSIRICFNRTLVANWKYANSSVTQVNTIFDSKWNRRWQLVVKVLRLEGSKRLRESGNSRQQISMAGSSITYNWVVFETWLDKLTGDFAWCEVDAKFCLRQELLTAAANWESQSLRSLQRLRVFSKSIVNHAAESQGGETTAYTGDFNYRDWVL